MKIRNLAFALAAAASLPIVAYASDNMDPISTSFDRDINREMSVSYLPVAATGTDPLDVVNTTLRKGPDPVLVSFIRDMYREPVAYKITPTERQTDPLDVINVALQCGNTDFVNAGINLGHNRC